MLIDKLNVGKGQITPEDLYAVINKRIERTLIRTVMSCFILYFHWNVLIYSDIIFLSLNQEGGSYQQRILVEYLQGIELRAREIVEVLRGT